MTAPEGDLDARLQRARSIDWRFALPDPAPTTVVTSGRVPRQVAEAMAEAGWQAATAEADLAVTFDPDDAALRAALTALRDDGTLCVMWRRRLGRLPRRGVASRSGTAADLRRRGLEVRWHVLVPNASATGAIVPLTTPQPLELLLRRRSGVTGSRAVRWLAELLRRHGLLIRLAPAVLLVAHRRLAVRPRVGGAATGPHIAALTGSDAISRHLAGLRLDDPDLPIPERHGPPLLLTPRFRASRHVVALVPRGDGRDQGPLGSGDPALVLKVARIADRGEVARREAAALQRIAAGPAGRRATAPALVHLGRPWDLPTLVETAVSGRPLDPAVVRRDPERAIAAVSAWLASMVGSADTPESGAVLAHDRIERLLDSPLTTFMAAWSGREEQPLLAATRAAGDTVRAARLPIAFEHGDASHPNLLRRSDGSLAAVDWERAEPEGLPLHDLTTFLAYVAVVRARTAGRHDEGEVIASSLLAADGWAARALAEHSQRIGVEPGCARALVTISLARLTMGLAERLEDDRTLPPSASTVDWLRGHRYHVAWRSVALAAPTPMTSTAPARTRLLYITNGFPYPLTSGYLRHYFLMGELAAAGHDIVLLSIVGADHRPEHAAALADRTERVETFRSLDRATGTLQRLIRRARRLLPSGLADPAARRLADRASELIRRERFDAVVFSGKRTDAALDRLETLPVVVDMCDAATLRLKREMAVAGPSRRAALEVMARQVRRTERRMLDRADRSLFASARDLEGLLHEFADGGEASSTAERARRSVVVPNGVDTRFWSRGSATLGAEIVFTGAMNYGPNVDAAVRLARTIFPLVRRAVPTARLALVGRDPVPDVQGLGDIDGIRVTGYVDDVRPFLESAAVFAAPLRFGAGIQNKLLEAMSMAVPAVVSTLAADGLRTVDGSVPPIGIVDDDDATAAAIVATLRRVAADPTPHWAARAYVEQHFSWEASGASLANLIAAARADWHRSGQA